MYSAVIRDFFGFSYLFISVIALPFIASVRVVTCVVVDRHVVIVTFIVSMDVVFVLFAA